MNKVSWKNTDNLQKLVDIVLSSTNTEEGLNKAAEHFETTFFAVRNKWYSNEAKKLRGVAYTPKEIKDMERQANAYVDAYNVTGTIVEAARTFIDVTNREVAFLRQSIIEMQKQLSLKDAEITGYKGKITNLEKKNEEILADFTVLSRILNRARVIANEEVIGLQPEGKRYLIDGTGQVNTVG